MFKSLRVLGMGLVAPLLACAQVSGSVPLVIAAENGAGPWGGPDGTGCGNDLVRAAFAAAKVPVRLEVMPYARAKSGTLAGRYVACFGMAWTPDLSGRIVFADKPLYRVTAVLMQSRSRPLHATSARDLRIGTRTGTVLGYEYPPAVDDLARRRILEIRPAYSEVISLRNLDLHRIEAALVVVDELKSVDYLLAQAGLTGRVEPACALGKQDTYIGFSTAHPQWEYARAKFNEGFEILLKNGTYKRILDTWKVMPP